MSVQASVRRELDERSVRARWSTPRLLVLGGIVGPVVFTVAFIVQAFFKPGYSHVSDPVSALAAGANGWLQDVNFFVFGALMVAFAIGLHRAMRPTRPGVVAVALLVLSGVGLVVAGAFPARDATGAFDVGPGHLTGAILAFVGAGTGLIALAPRMARDHDWSDLATYTRASGIAIVGLFLVTARLAAPDGAPLHDWTGLLQRAAVALWFSCTIVVALRARRNG